MTTATVKNHAAAPPHQARPLPPVLGRLLRGSFWLALKTPLQVIFAFWSIPLIIGYIGQDAYGAFGFAWGFGFIQFLLEFGMSSALQRQVSDCWTRGDRAGVNRAIACGTTFYAALAVLQAATLLAIATFAAPHSGFSGPSLRLAIQLLWLQALTAPCYGFSTVVTSVLQAARRYEFIPRLELVAVTIRFALLYVGIKLGVGFFWIIAAQVLGQIALLLLPGLWVMVRDLGFTPRFRGASWPEFQGLMKISIYVFIIQVSVVLADRIDTTILGFALPQGVAGPATAVYQVVSKPFTQVRQTGWMLTYLVMPAVASLAAAGDAAGLERLKYDGSRFLIGLLTPITLLAAFDAAPFLHLWVGPRYAAEAWLMRLFLIATLPLMVSVLVQMSIGVGNVKVIALAALIGSLVNLPISYVLTMRLGVAGVIWGTVLTTLFSNLLVPGIHAARVLDVRLGTFARRSLAAPFTGALALIAVVMLARLLGWTSDPTGAIADALAAGLPMLPEKLARATPMLAELSLGCIGYLGGYAWNAQGRADLDIALARVGLKRKPAIAAP